MNTLLVIFWGVVILSVTVFVHEGGHFLAARACKVRVSEFMIGLPGPSIGFVHKGCRFGVTAVPLGGYARIAGMETTDEPELLADALAYVYRHGSTDVRNLAFALNVDEAEATDLLFMLSSWASVTTPKGTPTGEVYLAPADGVYSKGQPRPVSDPRALLDEQRTGTYRGLPCWKRLCILFAGPLANVLFAVVIVVVLLSAHGVYEPTTTLADVVSDSPAATAGLQAGDTITRIDDLQISSWDDIGSALADKQAGDSIAVAYMRDGAPHEARMQLYENDGRVQMGIYAGTELVRMSVAQAIGTSGEYTWRMVEAVGQLLNPSTAKNTLDQSTSVIGIAYETKAAADRGALSLLMIAVAISLSLGVMNLLPIPPLDGGKIVIEIGQKISRRNLPERANAYLSYAGIILFVVLFVYLTFQDIGRYVIGG